MTDSVRAEHTLRHNQEDQLKKLQKQRQHKMDDDFVLWVKANKLNEYRSHLLDYEPDFDYIFDRYHFEKEELLQIAKNFNGQFYDFLHGYFSVCSEYPFEYGHLIYLVENHEFPIDVLLDRLDDFMFMLDSEQFVSATLMYFLDINYKIKPEWVARAIEDDNLIERIKEKYTFTFDEIYGAHNEDILYSNELVDDFYVQVHKHFPDFMII